jgi:hypothetical protein
MHLPMERASRKFDLGTIRIQGNWEKEPNLPELGFDSHLISCP